MVNRSTGKAPFSIVYTKAPSHTTDLLHLPNSKHTPVDNLASRITKTIEDVRAKLQQSNLQYKDAADAHKRLKIFNAGDLVMIYLRKHRFPVGEYSKLKPRKYRPFQILSKSNDNAYVIDIPGEWNIANTFNVSDIYEYFAEEDGSFSFVTTSLGTSSLQEGEI